MFWHACCCACVSSKCWATFVLEALQVVMAQELYGDLHQGAHHNLLETLLETWGGGDLIGMGGGGRGREAWSRQTRS
jgi:hypothetical protein